MFEVFIGNFPPLMTKMFDRLFDVNRIPNGDGRDHEVERTGTIVLILQTAGHCMAGNRAGPPESSGGPWIYSKFLHSRRSRKGRVSRKW